MSASYAYQPLEIDAPHIRLLTILPDETGSPIRITLRVANLADVPRPAYETVSYVWGDPTPSASLKVSGHGNGPRYYCLYVPASSAAVLNQIRLPDQKRTVWQDAVCINQDDLVERGRQVSLMSKTYSDSTGNIVYLGELDGPDMSDRISRTVASLLSNAGRRTNGFSTFGTTTRDDTAAEYRVGYSDRQDQTDEEVIFLLLELPWFRRLWTVQEAALAPRNTAVLGTLWLDLLDILRALVWWRYSSEYFNRSPWPSMKAEAGMYCINQSHGYIDHDQGVPAGRAGGIMSSLVCSTLFEKTEPRDGVFAILGLISKTSSQFLTPDYTKPLSEILQRATRLAFLEMGDLDLLRSVRNRSGDLEGAHVASWVLRADRQIDTAVDASRLRNVFVAAEWLEGDYSLLNCGSLDSASLMARGYTVCKVGAFSRVCSQAEYGYYHTWLLWIKDVFGLWIVQTSSEGPRRTWRAFGRTLLGGGFLVNKSQPATDENMKPLDDFTDLLWKTTGNEKDAIMQQSLDVALETLCTTFQTWPTVNRRLFVSNSGQSGLGPSVMQPGDTVALLRGVRTPTILRPLSNGHYQVVGEAYVDGVMFGEAWEECKTTGAVEEEFLLV
ncbi:hypothetical protein LTR56_001751 [Elasticomyces elasticus]|nr:hypothetical protein LTR56_001751 [Elasticomyces elasticus]KAK3668898.1 hypothetical protein LTR22_000378 [Elasticomyces elasticus]KAK4925014.1 hypothetical protein LTR49_008020 [Elasticomyces elasticus]KAK5763271.1 hypothetical protein LTS12_006655 [Elasticomyces elasticus]